MLAPDDGAVAREREKQPRGWHLIDHVDLALRDWLGSMSDGVAVTLAPPTDTAEHPCISLYLLEIQSGGAVSRAAGFPLTLVLRYVVSVGGGDPLAAHRLLGVLLFAALDHPDFEVDMTAAPAELWRGLKIAPRPAFVLAAPLVDSRVPEPVPLVGAPPRLDVGGMTSIAGSLVGPGDGPIAGASVEIPGLVATRTDARGRFRFAAVPQSPPVRRCRVRVKSRTFFVDVPPAVQTGAPLTIRFNPEESDDG